MLGPCWSVLDFFLNYINNNVWNSFFTLKEKMLSWIFIGCFFLSVLWKLTVIMILSFRFWTQNYIVLDIHELSADRLSQDFLCRKRSVSCLWLAMFFTCSYDVLSLITILCLVIIFSTDTFWYKRLQKQHIVVPI